MRAIKSRWRDGAYDHSIEGGESIRDVEARGQRAIRHILTEEAGRTALVVTHGRYLRVLLASILEGHGLEDMHRLDHANTCVNRVVYANGQFQADLLNCTRHLTAQNDRC